MALRGPDHQTILGALSAKGPATSLELQAATGKSQPSVSRLLGELSSDVLTLDRGRATRYGLAKSIHGLPAQQPLWWIAEDGAPQRMGTLSLLAGDIVHVDSPAARGLSQGRLPWYLAPLRAQGFLGRLLAQRLGPFGLGTNPERWGIESTLFAALQLHDAPGAIVLGEPKGVARQLTLPARAAGMPAALDALASDVAKTLPVGSSASGEQPKFLAMLDAGTHVLVKFTPPRGTPFGDRWHDLLHAEALAAQVLARHGVPVAACRVIESARRTYLVSERFDRIGATGRRHAVSIGAVHDDFVAGSYNHWAGTCEALARQGRLAAIGAAQARALLDYGRLIGNTDMHSGNLSLLTSREGLAKGRFELAPVYDMLPMCWRPDPNLGGAADYAPFEPDPTSAASPARAPAREFWSGLAAGERVSPALRRVAIAMADRLRA